MWKLSDKSSDYYKSQDKLQNPVAEKSEQMSHILYVLWANCHVLAAFVFSKLIKHHVTDWLKLREIHTTKYYVSMKIKCCLVWTHKAFLSCLQGDGSRGQELNAEEINPLNTKLNLICHLLALLGAHPILHVSKIRVKNVFTTQQNKKKQQKDMKKYTEHAGRMV